MGGIAVRGHVDASDSHGVLLGAFEYNKFHRGDSRPRQTFPIVEPATNVAVVRMHSVNSIVAGFERAHLCATYGQGAVRLEVMSNHGASYTCE